MTLFAAQASIILVWTLAMIGLVKFEEATKRRYHGK